METKIESIVPVLFTAWGNWSEPGGDNLACVIVCLATGEGDARALFAERFPDVPCQGAEPGLVPNWLTAGLFPPALDGEAHHRLQRHLNRPRRGVLATAKTTHTPLTEDSA